MIRVAVVDYGLANVRSVVNALQCFDTDVQVAEEGDALAGAERIVLPGVGSFDAGMRNLRERGHVEALEARVRHEGVPCLGLCLGMQFLLEGSDEGTEPGLGWIAARARRFPSGPGLPKVPHFGWSEVDKVGDPQALRDLEPPLDFYFAHSYYVPLEGAAGEAAIATCEHGLRFAAAVASGSALGVQFHPEKSQLAGLKLIEAFLAA